MTTAHCENCRSNYKWRGAPEVTHAGCPRCAQPLRKGARAGWLQDDMIVMKAMFSVTSGRRVGFVAPGIDPGEGNMTV